MIKGVTGLPGSGKTLYLLWVMQQAVLGGRAVATNIALTERCPFFNDVIFMDDEEYPVFELKGKEARAFWHYMPPGCLYVIDEVDNYFDSMDFTRLHDAGNDTRLYFKQHRKRRDDLVLCVQNLDNLWTRIRRMVQSWVVCDWNYRSYPLMKWLPISISKFWRGEFGHESLRAETFLSSGYFTYAEAEEMFSWYDTEQLIGGADLYRWSNDFSRSSTPGGEGEISRAGSAPSNSEEAGWNRLSNSGAFVADLLRPSGLLETVASR